MSDDIYPKNEAFANRYIDEFIGQCIEDQFIPDILLEIMGELDREVNITDRKVENSERANMNNSL